MNGDKDMPFNYLGRKTSNKVLALPLSITITSKGTKDLGRGPRAAQPGGGEHDCGQ